MGCEMRYLHVALPSTDSIAKRIETAFITYWRETSQRPDRIELGDQEWRAHEDYFSFIETDVRRWGGIEIRRVESPSYMAATGKHLTVDVTQMLDFDVTMLSYEQA